MPAFLEYIVFISLVCVKLILLYGKTDNVFIYALSALTIIIITWLFIRKKENLQKSVNFTYLYLLSACICAGIACSIVSGFISYFTYELNIKDWNSDKIIFASHNSDANFLLHAIVGRIPLTVLDRIITTFTGFGVFKLYFYLKNKRGEGK